MTQKYVPYNWLELLNTDGKCPILTATGESTGAEVRVSETHGGIWNMFGFKELIPVKAIANDCGKMDVYFQNDNSMYLYPWASGEKILKTVWEY